MKLKTKRCLLFPVGSPADLVEVECKPDPDGGRFLVAEIQTKFRIREGEILEASEEERGQMERQGIKGFNERKENEK